MSRLILTVGIIALFCGLCGDARAHCQIPCGIYGDFLRIESMREHVQTIEKSMNLINDLSQNPAQNMNQVVRWVNNKDEHADKLTEIVTYYFLAQRIKIKDSDDQEAFADYQQKLTLLHQMMVYSMKSKQTTDLKNVETLKSLITEFSKIYFSKEDLKHLEGH